MALSTHRGRWDYRHLFDYMYLCAEGAKNAQRICARHHIMFISIVCACNGRLWRFPPPYFVLLHKSFGIN